MKAPSFLYSFKYAIRGLFHALRTERNVRFHSCAAIVALASGLYLGFTWSEMLYLWTAIFMVLVSEMINTAIEVVVDLVVGDEYHPLAAIAKNVAAGAVLLAAIYALIVGVYLYTPYIF